ncbi:MULTISPECIES: exosortase F system-associated protein [unclassified Leeuwenhoekiella]|uniref:exosortase F system-associated membrane protein n=1 Tax=unclassified Leeuwenhoekiella TaxID=2615029 RepID=UPI000C68BDC6|nr:MULTISPECIES: exosortase F system-associated protein [unclassified Leeuwenhoekiella]MAW97194.1 exosortase F system-associated protein [Leeuwenhoekiella sp.]MBA82720.1 exosortase F system-associated protein [Leeuwenhoekiella sp.]|tara:strand:- start:30323 stop:30760 length:438 start_codon:yes stop_codon:yes gene_type:complete
MRKAVVLLVCFILIIALVCIRIFENELFYDPLILFFKSAYLYETALPKLDFLKLIIHAMIRFWLNAAISIIFILLLFRNRENFKILLLIYAVVFVVLLTAFILVLKNYSIDLNLLLFYIRRFLIQPMLLLILIPAFYYQRLKSKA